MKKVDIPQVLISTAAIFGLGLLWYDFNMKIFLTVRDLMKATLFDKPWDLSLPSDAEDSNTVADTVLVGRNFEVAAEKMK